MQRQDSRRSVPRVGARALAASISAVLTFTSVVGHAQAPPASPAYPPPPPPAAYPPSPAPPASPGAYPAPLSQTTQETYVPQSVALSGPDEINSWEPGEPIPPGYHPAERLRKGLIIGGAITFGVLYLFSAIGAAAVHDANASVGGSDNADALYIPALGPFMQMTRTTSALGNVYNAIDGAGQCAGLVMLIVGLTSPRTILVRNDIGAIRVQPMPYVSSHSAGLGLVASF
ncbi:MAG TPA: hypothetical protein VGY54_25400 [Polyangiaceae bacterium]|nr:hypothetical protein [Polyangiaceae bacterium]